MKKLRGLSLVFGILWSLQAPLANCLVFEKTLLLGPNFRDVSIDPVAKKKWVESHPPERRSAAKFLADNIKIVSRKQFEASLAKGLSKLLAKIPEGESLALVVPHGRPGHVWTTRYAQLLHPRLKSAALVRDDQLKHFLNHHPTQHLIAIDDFAYSGHDMSNEVHNFHTVISARDSSVPQPALHFFRVAGTAQAKARAEGVTSTLPLMKITIDYGINIPTILEMKGFDTSPAFYDLLDNLKIPLTIPFYKMPDSISFPHRIRMGFVGEKPLPFIHYPPPRVGEPYRQKSFTESEISLTDEFEEGAAP